MTAAANGDLCAEWREIGMQAWSYATGSRGKSRGDLERLVEGWKQRNPAFEWRIRPFVITSSDIVHYN